MCKSNQINLTHFLQFMFCYKWNEQHKHKMNLTNWTLVFVLVDFQAIHTRFEYQAETSLL